MAPLHLASYVAQDSKMSNVLHKENSLKLTLTELMHIVMKI